MSDGEIICAAAFGDVVLQLCCIGAVHHQRRPVAIPGPGDVGERNGRVTKVAGETARVVERPRIQPRV